MKLEIADYNGAGSLANGKMAAEWTEIEQALTSIPVHFKGSDQAGIQGKPIFDPVGTNQAIKAALQPLGWQFDIPIPSSFKEFGLHVDFGKGQVLGEAQFSNYPFLLNNVFRFELIERMKIKVLSGPGVPLGVVVTKSGLFPASNSTLYYEQAKAFLDPLAAQGVLTIPIRLVGLTSDPGPSIPCVMTNYAARYARRHQGRRRTTCLIPPGKKMRAKIVVK